MSKEQEQIVFRQSLERIDTMGLEPAVYEKYKGTLETIKKSELLRSAFDLALHVHSVQSRNSGEPYITHCVEVFQILFDEWKVKDENYLAAALLHDTVEDSKKNNELDSSVPVITVDYLRLGFNGVIADLVEGVTKLKSSTDRETLKDFAKRTYLNPGIAVLKLADRLHNMRTLQFMSPEKQKEKSGETLHVYTKLAESLGMWRVKTELEDLCFQYSKPKEFAETKKQVDSDPRMNPMFTSYVQSSLVQLLDENGFTRNVNNPDSLVEIERGGYWILKEKQEKMATEGRGSSDSYQDVNDLVSFRVRLKTTDDCYKMLKEIHERFGKQVDFDRVDLFMGENHRENGYQALQTTINFKQGAVEVALVTEDMEEFNNHGVICLLEKPDVDLRKYIRKFVFTPSGSVRFLRPDAIGADFAAVLSEWLLNKATSIEIDGQERSLATVIPNASTVRVLIGGKAVDLGELVDLCSEPKTKELIEKRNHTTERGGYVKIGKREMEKTLKTRGLLDLGDLKDRWIKVVRQSYGELIEEMIIGETVTESLASSMGCDSLDELYYKLGKGRVSLDKLEKELNEAGITKQNLGLTTIRLKGPDQPRVLIDIVQIISGTNKNIFQIKQTTPGTEFNLRILVENLSQEEEETIRKQLDADPRFTEKLVV